MRRRSSYFLRWLMAESKRKRKIPSLPGEDSANKKPQTPCSRYSPSPTPASTSCFFLSLEAVRGLASGCNSHHGRRSQTTNLCWPWVNPSLLEKLLAVYLFQVSSPFQPNFSSFSVWILLSDTLSCYSSTLITAWFFSPLCSLHSEHPCVTHLETSPLRFSSNAVYSEKLSMSHRQLSHFFFCIHIALNPHFYYNTYCIPTIIYYS